MLEKLHYFFYIFLFTSLLGWIMETVGCSIAYDRFVARGSMTMPFCPIYGFAIILFYLLLKTPQQFMKSFKKNKQHQILYTAIRYIIYAILVGAISFVVEYSTGYIIDLIGARKLWDYSAYADNLNGYIRYSFIAYFAIGGTLYMSIVFPFIYRQVGLSNMKSIKATNYLFIILFIVDYFYIWFIK